ncbi:hypothetical protein XFEB_00020 [Xylella fastidiosa EB92.1]|nr:hypothetical protein XFEB_00020 [Xylella fastidiosa EB92.1]
MKKWPHNGVILLDKFKALHCFISSIISINKCAEKIPLLSWICKMKLIIPSYFLGSKRQEECRVVVMGRRSISYRSV